MRLIECYVENFGKLSGHREVFSEGINSYVRENGYGKSTLAAFIRAMLFGLSDSKKGDLSENERRHYLPWNSGVCAGWLTFESNLGAFRVERSFGKKPSEDSFALYDLKTGKRSDAYTENLGKELFGIDKDGFERTVFLSERNLSGKNDNKSISEKLSNLSGTEGDIGYMDEALSALDARRKFFAKRGGAGEIREIENKRARTASELCDIEAKKLERDWAHTELLAVREDIKKIKVQRESLQSALALVKESERILALRERIKEKEAERDSCLAELRAQDGFFLRGIPCARELDESRISNIRAESILGESIPEESAQLSALKEKYGTVTKEELDAAISEARSGSVAPFYKDKRVVLTAGTALSVLGTALLFFLLPLGIILAALGVSAVIYSLIFCKKHKKFATRVEKTLSKLGLACDGDALSQLTLARGEYTRLEILTEERERELKEREKLRREGERMLSEVQEFLSGFRTETALPYEEIREAIDKRGKLTEKIKALEAEISGYLEYVKGHDTPTAIPENPEAELAAALSREGELISAERTLEYRLSRLEDEILREDDLTAELSEYDEKLSKYNEELKVIQLTKRYLTAACDNMTAKYLGKTKEAFGKYVKMIGGAEGDFGLDTSFEVTKSEYGAARAAEAFSMGWKNLYYLSVRLALVDALYENEAPFLVFDDPFVSFDDEKCVAALDALRELGRGRQILYFTCSEARSLN